MNLNTVFWPRKKIVYLAIGKTASTSIKRAIARDMGRPVPGGESPHFSANLDYALDVEDILKRLDDGWLSLVVERNPVDRFVSWYQDKINRPDGPSKYTEEYSFEAGPLDACAYHLTHNVPLIVKQQMETHLAPQRYLQRKILSGRKVNIRLPFSNVGPAFHSLFGVELQTHNATEGPRRDKVVGHTRKILETYYHADKDIK